MKKKTRFVSSMRVIDSSGVAHVHQLGSKIEEPKKESSLVAEYLRPPQSVIDDERPVFPGERLTYLDFPKREFPGMKLLAKVKNGSID